MKKEGFLICNYFIINDLQKIPKQFTQQNSVNGQNSALELSKRAFTLLFFIVLTFSKNKQIPLF